ncbi:hypothetical protein C8R44DRAFT_868652 [Mycena epipterygia]|nr:hypothetical protein C8R44DRAFT_868652 [Mycena epipterygia]
MFNKLFFSAIFAILVLGQGVVSQDLGSASEERRCDPPCPTGSFCCTPGPAHIGGDTTP